MQPLVNFRSSEGPVKQMHMPGNFCLGTRMALLECSVSQLLECGIHVLMCRDCINAKFLMATWVRTSQVPFSLFHFQGLEHEHSILSMFTSPPPYLFFLGKSLLCYIFLLLLSKVALVAMKSGGQHLSCSNVVLSFGHLPQPRSSYQFGLGTVC